MRLSGLPQILQEKSACAGFFIDGKVRILRIRRTFSPRTMFGQSDTSPEELRGFGNTIRITPSREIVLPYLPSKTDYYHHGFSVADEDENESIAMIFEQAQEAAMSIIE